MNFSLFWGYFFWHYGTAYTDLTRFFRNYLDWLNDLFSVGVLLKTFFQPLQKSSMSYKGKTKFADLFGVFAFNMFMRSVGALLRLFLIISGIVLILVWLALWPMAYIAWSLWPIIIVAGITFGLTSIFSV